MTSHRWTAVLCAAVLGATAFVGGAGLAPDSAQAATTVRITPNPAAPSEPFEGWGTSLVWFANATGGYPEAVRQDLLDKVFGEDGLNLNIARYNIGGGNATDVPPYLRPGGAVAGWWNPDLAASDAQGKITSTFADRARYAAAWNPDDPASYNWDADATQRWWIEALKDRITRWEAFSNSPPYFLTESGFVSGGFDGWAEQLAPEDMDAFAGYLVTVVEHLEKTYGISFDSLEPFNEPNTNYWSTRLGADGWPTTASRQEGAHIGPARQDQMIKALAARLADSATTTDVPISAMDETTPSRFIEDWNGWSTQAKDAVSQLNVHTYGTSDRTAVRDIAKAADKPLWMSEVEGNWDTSGQFNLVNIDNGLGVAGRIVDDLRELEPRAWVFWQPVEDYYNMQKVENLNWGSVFVDFDCNAQGQSERRLADGDPDPSCRVLTNAKYNTVRNFTHYIRPGDRLIPTDDAQTTAALSDSGVTLVHVNTDAGAREVTLDLSSFGTIAQGATVTPIVTTESPASDVTANALVEGAAVPVNAATRSATLTVPGKSVTTFLVSGVSGVSPDAVRVADGQKYQLIGDQSGKALAADGSALRIRAGATTTDAAARQSWTVRTISGEGTNRQRIGLQNADGRYLASVGSTLTLVDADQARVASDKSLQWIPSTTDGRRFSFLNVASEQTMDVNQASTADGATVGLWRSNNGGNQRWALASTAIRSIDEVTVSTVPGRAPELPAQVTARYDGGVTRTADVAWDLAGVDWSAPGTVVVTGRGTDLFGTPFDTARATVEVGGYAGVRPVSVTTYAGAALSRVTAAAPTVVPAEVRPGGPTYDTAVRWDWSGLSDASFAAPGIVTVPGTAASNVPGADPLTATLTVIVTAAGERNVAPQSTPSATFTESSAYSVTRTINGDTSDKGWSNWRPGTKNAQDTLSYALADTEKVRHVAVWFYRDGGATWPTSLRVEYRTAGGAWTAGDTIPVPNPGGTAAPMIDVPLGDVAADEVRVVMTAAPATHMVVSEVQIFALTATPAAVADLARLTVGDALLPGVTPDRTDYSATSPGSAWPTVGAVPVDAAASVSIVQPADADGVARVTITAADGSTTKAYRVAVTRKVVVEAPTVSGEAKVGAVVTASVPATDPAQATLAYRWERDGEAIPGAEAAAYALTDADLGHQVRVRVAASVTGFGDGFATSEPIVPVRGDTPVTPGSPVTDHSAGPGGTGRDGDLASTGAAAGGLLPTALLLLVAGGVVAAVAAWRRRGRA